MSLKHYAQRLLNPFRGVMNIIEFEAAEAVTIDGLHWDIYVRDAELVRDMPNSSRVQTSDIRYGSWSEEQGLKRGALYPSDDFMYLEHMGAIVYDHLLELHRDIPFPLRDCYELWLLDENYRPLALIDSTVKAENMDTDAAIDWRAGLACRNHFSSSVYDELLIHNPLSAGSYLTCYINSLAGHSPCAQWFRRDRQGSGYGLDGINLPASLLDRELNETCFDALMLDSDMHDSHHSQLIQDFFDWQAPWILLLQHLDDPQRSHFERQAKKRALTVEAQFNLYPRIVDQTQINAARVEAKLRHSHGPGQNPSGDEVMSTDYIELCPDPTLET